MTASSQPSTRVRALFRVDPPSYFGLPDGAKVVVPASAESPIEIVSPVMDSTSGALVSHGSVPVYRLAENAVRAEFAIGSIGFRIEDNFITTELGAENLRGGVELARAAVTSLLRHLMVEQGDFFRASLVQYEIVGEPARLASQPIKLMELAAYNLAELQTRIQRSVDAALVSDERLDKALLYYEQARFLYTLGADPSFAERHRNYLVSSAFLFIWKAITTILGEPGTDRDYQRRFKTFGLAADYWRAKIEPLKSVRDAADVAHYDLDPAAVARPVAEFGSAEATCREVLKAYSEFLIRKAHADPDAAI